MNAGEVRTVRRLENLRYDCRLENRRYGRLENLRYVCRLENRRYGRLENLRYDCRLKTGDTAGWKTCATTAGEKTGEPYASQTR